MIRAGTVAMTVVARKDGAPARKASRYRKNMADASTTAVTTPMPGGRCVR